jgi:hypothetical protein
MATDRSSAIRVVVRRLNRRPHTNIGAFADVAGSHRLGLTEVHAGLPKGLFVMQQSPRWDGHGSTGEEV